MVLVIVDRGDPREILDSEFPLAIGISKTGLLIFGEAGEHAPALWVRTHQGRVFVQPNYGSVRALYNGTPLDNSTWLAIGDEIQISAQLIKIDEVDGKLSISINHENFVEEPEILEPVTAEVIISEPPTRSARLSRSCLDPSRA